MGNQPLFFDAVLGTAFDSVIGNALTLDMHDLDSRGTLRAEWDRAMASYLAAEALASADRSFGHLYNAETDLDCTKITLTTKYGKTFASDPEGSQIWDHARKAFGKATDRHEDSFLKPLWAAEAKLARTPAPDLKALAFKIEFIRRHSLMQDEGWSTEAFEICRADVRRLTSESVR